MSLMPVVRHMLLCDEGPDGRRITIVGLTWNISATGTPPYPCTHSRLSVFLALASGRGQGTGRVTCVAEDTGETIFASTARPITFPASPLEVVGMSFRFLGYRFPRPGRYSIEFWYNAEMLADHPLTLR